MKVVITGATWPTGSSSIKQCIKDPHISSVVVLSRHKIPTKEQSSDPKVKFVVRELFDAYSDELLNELEGPEACMWWELSKDFPPT